MLKTRADGCQTRSRWLRKPIQSNRYQKWLIDRGSLTQALQNTATVQKQKFSVTLLSQRQQKPLQDEYAALRLRAHQYALVRQVSLCINQQAVVFAHSVLPKKSLRGVWLGLAALGNRPLGGALFANPKIVRTPLVYQKLGVNHALYHALLSAIPIIHNTNNLWARRSIFKLHGASIMVTEVFLPHLIKANRS